MDRNAELLGVPGYNMFRGSLEGTPRTATSVSATSVSATLSILPDNNCVGWIRVFRIDTTDRRPAMT
jgi:hypothetical protein